MKSLMAFLVLVAAAATTVDINTASLKELDRLVGVGPAIAQRIVEARPYSSIDDLLRVKGIGPATLEKIKAQGLVSLANPAPIKPATQPAAVSTALSSTLPKEETSAKTGNVILFFAAAAITAACGAIILFITVKKYHVRS